MIGKYFQIRNGNFDNPEINKDQADDPADEAAREEKSLKKGTLALSSTPISSMLASQPKTSMDSKGNGAVISTLSFGFYWEVF